MVSASPWMSQDLHTCRDARTVAHPRDGIDPPPGVRVLVRVDAHPVGEGPDLIGVVDAGQADEPLDSDGRVRTRAAELLSGERHEGREVAAGRVAQHDHARWRVTEGGGPLRRPAHGTGDVVDRLGEPAARPGGGVGDEGSGGAVSRQPTREWLQARGVGARPASAGHHDDQGRGPVDGCETQLRGQAGQVVRDEWACGGR